MTRGAPQRDERIIYTDEAVYVGLILFPPRTCSGCHAVLPANTDYFARNKQAADDSGLSYNCRRCRREIQRVVDRRRRKAGAER